MKLWRRTGPLYANCPPPSKSVRRTLPPTSDVGISEIKRRGDESTGPPT